MSAIKTVNDLFKLAGGSVHVASLLNLNQYTVDRWRKTGIPQSHWAKLSQKYGVDAETLYNMSQKART